MLMNKIPVSGMYYFFCSIWMVNVIPNGWILFWWKMDHMNNKIFLLELVYTIVRTKQNYIDVIKVLNKLTMNS